MAVRQELLEGKGGWAKPLDQLGYVLRGVLRTGEIDRVKGLFDVARRILEAANATLPGEKVTQTLLDMKRIPPEIIMYDSLWGGKTKVNLEIDLDLLSDLGVVPEGDYTKGFPEGAENRSLIGLLRLDGKEVKQEVIKYRHHPTVIEYIKETDISGVSIGIGIREDRLESESRRPGVPDIEYWKIKISPQAYASSF